MEFVALRTANGVEQVRWGCANCGYREIECHPHTEHPRRGEYPLIAGRNTDPARRFDHAAYLATEAWIERREAAKARCGWRCQLCGDTESPLHVHHNTYARLGAELETDLTVLCALCHHCFHDRAALADSRAQRCVRHAA